MTHPASKSGLWLIPLLAFLACSIPAHAQSALWNAIKGKAQDKAISAVEKSIGQSSDTQTEDADRTPHRHMLSIHSGSPFTAGNVPIFHDDFAGVHVGAMPSTWKTNGSAEVVTLDGIPGNWLKVRGWSTLKLVKPPHLPQHFTVQFDVIAVADQVQDLDSLDFGFAHNNSVRAFINDAYNDGAINDVEINYMNHGGGSVSSSATGYHVPINFNLEGYANTPMHVAIDVDGDNMKVYLDHSKVADSKQFLGHKSRYFFLSYGLKSRHGAALLFGNFRMDGFKPTP